MRKNQQPERHAHLWYIQFFSYKKIRRLSDDLLSSGCNFFPSAVNRKFFTSEICIFRCGFLSTLLQDLFIPLMYRGSQFITTGLTYRTPIEIYNAYLRMFPRSSGSSSPD